MTVSDPDHQRRPREHLRLAPALACALIACAGAVAAAGAPGQDLQQKLNSTQQKLSHAQAHAGVLTGQISHESTQIDRLVTQVADLRNREVAIAAQLAQKQAELDQAQAQLDALKQRLREAIKILEDRLVASTSPTSRT